MRLNYLCLLLLTFAFSHQLEAQKSRQMEIPFGGEIAPMGISTDYSPALRRIEAPYPGGQRYRNYLDSIKSNLSTLHGEPTGGLNAAKTSGGPDRPQLLTNFNANTYNFSVPNDNDFAISNSGAIVSVTNTRIYMYDSSGTNLFWTSLDTFCGPLNLPNVKYDPRALYDPIHDRFIFSCLNGFVDSTSMVIVGFSQTNDPTGNWNLYALPGDPNNDTLWTDYPIMALTENELFLTGNLLMNDESWQLGFVESICWQINLDDGYAGANLGTNLWYDVLFGGAPIRNLCPVQGGTTPAGPNMYFVSNRNFAVANDTVFIMEITDTIGAPSTQFLVDYGLTDTAYGMPPNARQRFNQYLYTNDARWLDAVLENGNIHFVGNTYVPATGYCGAYHGIITDITGSRTVTGSILGDPVLDFGYPGIAHAGLSPTDNDYMILANYSGPNTFASYGMIFYDGAADAHSDIKGARAGTGYINILSGPDRWGDYSGIQTKYNSPGTVWSAATWGRSNNDPGTWIAEWLTPFIVGNEPALAAPEVVAFPNPTMDYVSLQFQVEAPVFGEIALYDLQGRLVKSLLQDRLRSGLNEFTFSSAPLAPGTYFLQIKADGVVLATKKVIKQ